MRNNNERRENLIPDDVKKVFASGLSALKNKLAVVKEKVQHELDPNTRFERLLRSRLEYLKKAGFSEEEAKKLALKSVQNKLDEIV